MLQINVNINSCRGFNYVNGILQYLTVSLLLINAGHSLLKTSILER